MDHRGHDYAPTPLHDGRRADLVAILNARPADAAMLERMVYGPEPITADTRAMIAEWCT